MLNANIYAKLMACINKFVCVYLCADGLRVIVNAPFFANLLHAPVDEAENEERKIYLQLVAFMRNLMPSRWVVD
jgi:hypothetical protein